MNVSLSRSNLEAAAVAHEPAPQSPEDALSMLQFALSAANVGTWQWDVRTGGLLVRQS